MSLKNGHVHSVKGSTITVAFTSSFHRDKCNKADGLRRMEEALLGHFHVPLRVECTVETLANTPVGDDLVNIAEAAAEVF
jgi:hypothetical protein